MKAEHANYRHEIRTCTYNTYWSREREGLEYIIPRLIYAKWCSMCMSGVKSAMVTQYTSCVLCSDANSSRAIRKLVRRKLLRKVRK